MAETRPLGDVAALVETERQAAATRRRRLTVIAGVAAFLVASLWWMFSDGDGDAVTYRTEKVATDRLVVTVNATGTLQPPNQVEVGSELSGLIETGRVDFNDRVTKGQVLARLDTLKLSAEALQSEADLAAAEATLRERRASVVEADAEMIRIDAVRRASGGRVPSQHDYDAAKSALARAKAQVASAEAQIVLSRAKLDFNRTNLAKAEIRSPIDGVVLTRDVEPGQTIAASFQAPKLFKLAEDLAKMELVVDVDEADVGQVESGQEATFTVDAYAGRTFPARITQVRFASETVNGVVTYKAVLEVSNADLALRPGMTATADIVVAIVDDALVVPNEALRFVPPVEAREERSLLQQLMPFGRRSYEPPPRTVRSEKQRTIYRLQGGEPEAVTIQVGLSDGRRTQIVEGDIEAGADVVVDAKQPGSKQ